jgi:hypothetical protein
VELLEECERSGGAGTTAPCGDIHLDVLKSIENRFQENKQELSET